LQNSGWVKKGSPPLCSPSGKKLAAYLKEEPDVIVDSTPLEASRYSGCSVLNPHSGIVLDKAHILHLGNYPLFLIHSEGNENDKPYGEQLLEIAARMGIRPDSVLMDAGYDSFKLHALSYELFGATPMIQVRYDAVFAPEASEEAIRRKVNKLWKIGGNECRTSCGDAAVSPETRVLGAGGKVSPQSVAPEPGGVAGGTGPAGGL
jgi:hypothetical protein